MKHNWRIALSLLVVFLSGVLVGGISHRAYSVKADVKNDRRPRSPEEYRKRYVDEMNSRLHLDANQLSQLNTILDETRQRYNAAHAKIRPEMKQIHTEQVERVRSILTEAQKPEYAKILEEREKRMRDSRKKTEGAKP